MTIDSTLAALEASLESDSDTTTSVGWTNAAIAIHSILQIRVPLFLKLEVPAYEPLVIDFRHHAFFWSTSLAAFPPDPGSVLVETEATTAEAPALFPLPGSNLDSLLWLVGLHSFDGRPASWLRQGERYRLARWPNLTAHAHSMEQLRLVAMLGNAHLSVDELAAVSGEDVATAQSLVNALSLMGILDTATVEEAPAAVQRPTETALRSRSLFGRLRDKLGL